LSLFYSAGRYQPFFPPILAFGNTTAEYWTLRILAALLLFALMGGSAVPAKLVLKSFRQNNLYEGIVMEPKIVRKAAFKVAGFETKTTNVGGVNYTVLPKFWERYFTENWSSMLHQQIKPLNPAELGICFPGGLEKGQFSYVIGVEVADFKDIPDDLFKGEVPAATYTVFTSPSRGLAGRAVFQGHSRNLGLYLRLVVPGVRLRIQ